MHTVRLDSGELRFQVKLPSGHVSEWKTDLVTLRIEAENLEKACELAIVNGEVFATPAFLTALAARYVELGCPECDATQARAVWIAVNRRFSAVDADLQTQLQKLK